MALTILFWNVHRNCVAKEIVALAREHTVDLLCLAESPLPDQAVLDALNSCENAAYVGLPVVKCRRRLATYYRPFRVRVDFVFDDDNDEYVGVNAVPHGGDHVLVMFAHLRMQLYSTPEQLVKRAELLSLDIAHAERECGHSRTVLIGDLNMDPFHNAVVLPWALNATPSRQVASREHRTVDGRSYPLFYNPMWNLLGDETDGPAGSYYWDADPTSLYWHMVDQALVRPQLLAHWSIERLTIPTRAGTIPLVTKNDRPRQKAISDHLPLLLTLERCTD